MTGAEIAVWLQQAFDFILDFASDFLAFIVIVAVIAAFASYFGRNRVVPLAAALYAAVPLYLVFPFTQYVTTPLVHVVLYGALVFLAFVAFSGLASFVADGSLGFAQLTILSVAIAGMILAVAIHILPVEELYTFNIATRALFDSPEAFFFWLLAPLAAIYVFGRG